MVRKFWITILSVILCFGVCGCMDTRVNHSAYSDAVIAYLSDKYHEDFTVEALYQEFSGDTGNLIRLQCKGTKSDETFTVRCYLDSQITPQLLKIDGKDHAIEDNYAEMLCQNQLVLLLPTSEDADYVVKCKVDFYGRQPTIEEYSQGLSACLKNEDLRAYVKIYILSNGNKSAQALYKDVEQLVSEWAPNTAYVYFAIPEIYDAVVVEQMYANNRDNFGNYLSNEADVKQLWFTLYETASGLSARKLIKG